jgi:DNA-binding transcriptional LysR family regulator
LVTLDDLRVFTAVCRTGSLSAAVRDLGRTQSAVSQHVKRLERELGLSLVERHPRGVVPTPEGRLLHTAVTEGLGRIDQAVRRIEELARAHPARCVARRIGHPAGLSRCLRYRAKCRTRDDLSVPYMSPRSTVMEKGAVAFTVPVNMSPSL